VIAKRGEEKAISNHQWPIEKWAGCDGFKFFGPDHLGHLYAAVRGGAGSYEDFPELAFGEYGWVYGVPEDLITYLARADDHYLTEIAGAWSTRLAESPGFGSWKADELLGLLREVRKVAGKAVALGRPVVLWHSLAC
jgi:hypothetical protein